MIPIKDSPRALRFPFVNVVLIAANAAVFFWELSLGEGRLDGFIHHFGLIPARFWATDWQTFSAVVTAVIPVFTSMFVHAGWLHVAGNLLFLWIFGDNVEDRLGHVGYMLFYLLCGVGAALAQAGVARASAVPMVGASGAIAGVMGGYLFLYPKATVLTVIPVFFWFGTFNIPAWVYLLGWFGLQFFAGVLSLGGATAGVAWWAHLGGFILGAALVWVFPKCRRYPYGVRP